MLTSKPQKFWLNCQTPLEKKPAYDLSKFVSYLLTFEKPKCPSGDFMSRMNRLSGACPSHLFHPSQKPWNFASPPDTLSGMHKM